MESAEKDSFQRWLSSADFQFRHIGWHPLAFWIGKPASLCLHRADGGRAAALLASPDRLGTAWLHLFAAANPPGARAAWFRLWPEARAALTRPGVPSVWAMTTLGWLIELLLGSGFLEAGRVVAYTLRSPRPRPAGGSAIPVTPMREYDLAEIERLDHAAFSAPWQLDSEALTETRKRSLLAAVVRRDARIAGYLMAARTPQGVHITRIAVHPAEQNRGLGRALIDHLVDFVGRRGAPRITVNTQIENLRSQHLYRTAGFFDAGESYPVYRADLRGS